MIERISVANVATFHPSTPEVLDELRQFNYIFGSNGTGKTTISRVIADATFSNDCQCAWRNGAPLETVVLNRDFVEKNFSQLRGVFTLGEEASDTAEKIKAAKGEETKERDKLANLKRTLGGDDGTGGKKGELAQLEADYRDKFWVPVEKIKKEGKLVDALSGVLGNKTKCKERILTQAEHNTAALKPLADLEKRAETIFGIAPTKESALPTIGNSSMVAHETNPILEKKVIGKEDVDIAAMIKKLGNSDWVRQGLPYYEQDDRVCPFCQQRTTEEFAQSLKDYFDESFESDTKAIDTLISQYEVDARTIQSTIEGILTAPGKFLDVEKVKAEKSALDQTIAANTLRLDNKKKEPSQVVELYSLNAALTAIKGLIDDANVEVTKHNEMVDNLDTEKRTLTAEVWRFVLNELGVDLKQYREKKEEIDKAIAGLEKNMQDTEARIAAKTREIQKLEKQTTSIQPTINAINTTLQQFGFDSFSLADAGDGKHYKLVRATGEDARETLSEGEQGFVVFLYFYHLLKGSLSEAGMTTDRVVVFDDPVSSLDSDVLFIVSSLIKEVFQDCRDAVSNVKQVFILTHNVYFHKEVTYNNKRPQKDGVLNEESFWIVRKCGEHPKLERHDNNPIKTSYELLWIEVREAQAGGTTDPRIENTLRRILEHYFKILGSIDRDNICAKFDGPDKHVCNSLFSWINAGSHSAFDDAHIAPRETMTQNYLQVFKKIFEKTGHIAHYEMMMGDDVPAIVGFNKGGRAS